MLRFTDDNRMIVNNEMNIVSDSAAGESELYGIKLKRYNKGGGWCTAIINSAGTSGIEFYDNGNMRLLHHRSYWEPGR